MARYSRRGFVKGSAGVIAGETIVGVVNGQSSPVDIVTAIKENNEPVETETVTQDWYDYEQQVDKTLKQFNERNKTTQIFQILS